MFLHCSFNRWFGMIQSHPNTPQTPFRHLSYIQTPQNLFMLALWSALSGISYRSTPTGKGSNCIWFDFQLLFHQHSLGNIHDQSDTIQKPSRHHQAQCNHLSIQFVSSIHKTFGTQSNLFGCFLRSPVYVLCMSYAPRWLDSVWRVSRWCQIGPGYCQDCINGITIDKNHFV